MSNGAMISQPSKLNVIFCYAVNCAFNFERPTVDRYRAYRQTVEDLCSDGSKLRFPGVIVSP